MVSRTVRDKLRRVAAGTPGRKKAKRPVAARGKTTRREAGKRMMNELIQNLGKRGSAIKDRVGAMSPGKLRAITGKTTMKKPSVRTPASVRQKQLRAMKPAMQSMGLSPAAAKNMQRMAGPASMNKAIMAMVKKIKPSGTPTTADFKRARAELKKAKGK